MARTMQPTHTRRSPGWIRQLVGDDLAGDRGTVRTHEEPNRGDHLQGASDAQAQQQPQ